ncbi:MAG: PIN domain-containing protein [Nonlabens sp.]
MNIVLDTNIVFSALLSKHGTINDILLNSAVSFDFYPPSFLLEELRNHQSKLLKISGYSSDELEVLKQEIYRNINFIDIERINENVFEKAYLLTHDVDEFDTPFIALALELEAHLWTGDKKLIKGLLEKGVGFLLDTEQLKRIRE